MLTLQDIKNHNTKDKIFKNEFEPLNLFELLIYGEIGNKSSKLCVMELSELQKNSTRKVTREELINVLNSELPKYGYKFEIVRKRLLVVRLDNGEMKKPVVFCDENMVTGSLLCIIIMNIVTMLINILKEGFDFNTSIILGVVGLFTYILLCSIFIKRYRLRYNVYKLSKTIAPLDEINL